MIGGSPAEAAKELVRRLREEARVAVILVIAEQRDGKLNRATWETIAAAQAARRGGDADQGRRARRTTRQRRRRSSPAAAVAEVLVVEHPALATYTPDAFTHGAAAASSSATAPTFVLLPHTYQTRDFAPMLAARLRKPLITDVTGIKGTGDGRRRSRARCSRASWRREVQAGGRRRRSSSRSRSARSAPTPCRRAAPRR